MRKLINSCFNGGDIKFVAMFCAAIWAINQQNSDFLLVKHLQNQQLITY